MVLSICPWFLGVFIHLGYYSFGAKARLENILSSHYIICLWYKSSSNKSFIVYISPRIQYRCQCFYAVHKDQGFRLSRLGPKFILFSYSILYFLQLLKHNIYPIESPTGPKTQLQIKGGGNLVVGKNIEHIQGEVKFLQNLEGELADFNLYDTKLSPEEMALFNNCTIEKPYKPLFSFENSVIHTTNLVELPKISVRHVCGDLSPFYILFPEHMTRESAYSRCQILKGSLILPMNEEQNGHTLRIFARFRDQCISERQFLYWLGAKGNSSTEFWVSDENGEIIHWHNFPLYEGRPKQNEQCLAMVIIGSSYKWLPVICNALACTMCSFQQPPKLRLRGLCKASLFDRTLYLHGYENGAPKLDGIQHSKIFWNSSSWTMVSNKQSSLKASLSNTEYDSFPLGHRTWIIHGDQCTNGEVGWQDWIQMNNCIPELAY